MIKSIMLFDLRVPDIGPPPPVMYAAALEMAAFADKAGFDYLSLSEHHGSEDGYLPAPFVVGGAFAALTKRIGILLNAVILPFHDPVKIAEQIAVLDLVSGGRLSVVFGAGYVPSEFARFGVAINQRGKLLDEGLDIIIRALAGERFEARGREVFVRPLPQQHPHPPFILGGGVEASARRAARLGLAFAPMKPGLFGVYEEECAKLGKPVGARWGLQGPIMVHVTDDPDQGWARLEKHLLHNAGTYARWAAEQGDANSTYDGLVDIDAIRRSGKYAIVTPNQCIALAGEQARLHSSMVLQPLIGGLDPDEGWKSIHLYVDKVLPALKAG